MKNAKRLIGVTLMILIICLSGCASKGNRKEMIENSVREESAAKDDMFAMESGATEEYDSTEPAEAGENKTQAAQINPEKKLIRTVSMGIETEYFDDTTNELNQLCRSLSGYVGNSSLNNVGSTRHYSIEMRIPQENLEAFLNHVSSMGKMKIRYKNEDTQDVTLDYFDTQEHKKSLEVERERILQLIDQADSLEYVVSLEDKLSELRYQISSYESQLRRMDNQVSYSTVNVEIDEVEQITVEKDDTLGQRISSGLSATLHSIKDSVLNFIVWFVTQLPRLIIFAVVIFICVRIYTKVYRKKNKKEEKKEEK